MNDAIESKMQFVKVDGCYFKFKTCPTMSSLGVKKGGYHEKNRKPVRIR